jgi:hypothetical protein
VWILLPVRDAADSRRLARTADDIVTRTQEAADELPEGTVVVAENGTGDLLVLMADRSQPAWWDHETAEMHPIRTDWSGP